jgi:copper chaperone CopZ
MKNAVIVLALAGAALALFLVPGSPLAHPASAEEGGSEAITLHVEGMTCASCALTVRLVLERLDGVKKAVVKVDEKRAEVTYDPAKVRPEQMIAAINESGYTASLPGRPGKKEG